MENLENEMFYLVVLKKSLTYKKVNEYKDEFTK